MVSKIATSATSESTYGKMVGDDVSTAVRKKNVQSRENIPPIDPATKLDIAETPTDTISILGGQSRSSWTVLFAMCFFE